MAQTVNLLDWRERQRRDCLRLWGLLFAGAWLIALLLGIALRSGQGHLRTWRELHQTSDRALLQALIQREKQLTVQQQRQSLWLAHEHQREATRSWEATLTWLADQLPEQAWLTTLQWQGDALRFAGLANRFAALSQLDSIVRRWPGFRRVTPGPVKRDEQGRWQFSYQLEREVSDAAAR